MSDTGPRPRTAGNRRQATLADHALRWYASAARDLPWRSPATTAWGVLVSEFMLHQTPVARVEPIYREWLRRWPTAASLAAEPAGAAIQAWGRLGYPRRALRLHGCAVAITHRHGGVVPATVEGLLALPGVGAYTARAVAAFAYGQRVPVVDTNVRRLIARAVRGLADGGPATTASDLAQVEAMLPRVPDVAARASAALMELGALVCTARNPDCPDCPVQQECTWHRLGRPRTEAPRRKSPGYLGTDRQARGALLAVCREAPRGVGLDALDGAWPDREQSRRALAGLVQDGLIVKIRENFFGLPGMGL